MASKAADGCITVNGLLPTVVHLRTNRYLLLLLVHLIGAYPLQKLLTFSSANEVAFLFPTMRGYIVNGSMEHWLS